MSTPSAIEQFAASLKSLYEPAVIKTDGGDVTIHVRRLTREEVESVAFQDRVQPPVNGAAPADAPLEERFDHRDPEYLKQMQEGYLRSIPETLHLAVKGGIPGEDEAARKAWVDANLATSVSSALYWHVRNLSQDRDLVRIVNFSSPAA